MGILMSTLWRKIAGYSEFKICMIGLDNAGKTTILYKLHLGDVVTTYPTIGSNVEQVVYKNMKFQVWDLGGQDMLRPSWNLYYVNTQALIMVVDSCDTDRIDAARKELQSALSSEELKAAVVLIYANKQDMKGALTAAEISEGLSLHSIKSHSWHIQACSALTGEGLLPGLDWVTSNVDAK